MQCARNIFRWWCLMKASKSFGVNSLPIAAISCSPEKKTGERHEGSRTVSARDQCDDLSKTAHNRSMQLSTGVSKANGRIVETHKDTDVACVQ